jgi:glutamate synthase (NADPH) large chain
MTQRRPFGFPDAQGLYDPAYEKDGCGVGFVCNIKGKASHQILLDAEHMNRCMDHRGGVGYEKNSGDADRTAAQTPAASCQG